MNESELKVGDVIKSLDFINSDDCYYVGKVVSIAEVEGTFRAKTIKRVWLGLEDKKISDYFVAPLQGKMLLDDLGTRLTVIA